MLNYHDTVPISEVLAVECLTQKVQLVVKTVYYSSNGLNIRTTASLPHCYRIITALLYVVAHGCVLNFGD